MIPPVVTTNKTNKETVMALLKLMRAYSFDTGSIKINYNDKSFYYEVKKGKIINVVSR